MSDKKKRPSKYAYEEGSVKTFRLRKQTKKEAEDAALFFDGFLFPGLVEGETEKHLAGSKFDHDQSSHGMRYSGPRAASTRVFQAMSTDQQKKYLAGLEKRGMDGHVKLLKPYHKARLDGKAPRLKLDPKNPYKGSPQDKRQQRVQGRRERRSAAQFAAEKVAKDLGDDYAHSFKLFASGNLKSKLQTSWWAQRLPEMAKAWLQKGFLKPNEYAALIGIAEGYFKVKL